MKATWRISPWNDTGSVAFEVAIDGDAGKLVLGAGGLALCFPYETKTLGGYADPGGLNAHLITLEGWLGHQSDGNCLTLRIPSQVVMPNAYNLLIPITSAQLASLEARRGTEPSHLNILLSGTARISILGNRNGAATNEHGVLVRPEFAGEVQAVRTAGSNLVTLTISRERWLGILSEAGPRRFRLIELPLPMTKKLASVLDLLEQSVLLLRRGECSDAISKARKVVEGVLVETATHWGVSRPTDGHVKWCEGLGKRLERAWPDDPTGGLLFGRLLAAAWSWTSEDHHYSPTAISKRAEAEFAIGLASDLLLLASELVEAHPDRLSQAATPTSGHDILN